MEDARIAHNPAPEPPPSAAPSSSASSLARLSRLLHPRVYAGSLQGLTVAVAQPVDVADLAARHFGHCSADGSIRLSLLDSFLLSSLSALTLAPPLPLHALLSHGCRHIDRFPALLLTYCQCTARGWIVREGSKLGMDLLLYRQHDGAGAVEQQQRKSRQHSVYAVRVVEHRAAVESGDGGESESGSTARSSVSMQQLSAALRVSQSTKKRLLLSTVTVPANVAWTGKSGLAALSRCRVDLCEVSRWSPAVHVS